MNPFADAIAAQISAATELDREAVLDLLDTPPKENMGDYALPCFTLAKQWRKNPAQIARELAAAVVPDDHIATVQAAGPYLNFTLDRRRFVPYVLNQVLDRGERYGSLDQGAGKTLVIDFSSPNLAKPFSIAHLRSTATGHAIYRLHDFLGWRCVGINHLGDWGANFGQLLAAYTMWADPEQVKTNPVHQLQALYTRFNQELEDRPELQDQARDCLQKLEAGDPEMQALWRYFVDEGRQEAERIYQILGVEFDANMGESEFADQLGMVVERFTQAGLAKESEGALIVDLQEWDMAPCMLRTSRGTSTYHSRDLAALFYRYQQYGFDRMIYVTDPRQILHFQQIFKAVELLGVDWADRCEHAPFGLMSFKGANLSTRKGNMIFLEEVLDQAAERTRAIMAEKNPDLADKEEVARQVGVSAVVFADLDSRRIRDIVFDWDEVLNFDGETGPYIQYTHARFCSMLRKYGGPVDRTADLRGLVADAEMRVAKHLARFPQCLDHATRDSEASYVASYLIELATVANKFYNDVPVLVESDAALKDARIALVESVRQALRTGLFLLGMQAPEEM